MLKPGGMLLYSTCTFAKLEDEDTIQWILEEEPDLELVPIEPWEGACGGFDGMPVIRLFPHKIEGEGHFLALLRKKGTQAPDGGKFQAVSALTTDRVLHPERILHRCVVWNRRVISASGKLC